MAKDKSLSITLGLMHSNLYNSRHTVTGILADRKLKSVPVRFVRELERTIKGIELQLEALAIYYARNEQRPTADGQAVGK